MLFSLFYVNFSYAIDMATNVDLPSFKEIIGDKFNIGDFGGGLFLSMVVILMGLLPTLILSKGSSLLAILAVLILTMSFCIVCTWLASWFLLVVIALSSVLIAYGLKGLLGTRG